MSPPKGMTFVEVLIALAIFSILSVLGMRALESITQASDRLELRHQQLHDMTVLLRQLEQDFFHNDQATLSRGTRATTNEAEWRLNGAGVAYAIVDHGRVARLIASPEDKAVKTTTFNTRLKAIDILISQAGNWRELEQFDRRFKVQAVRLELHLATRGTVTKTILLPGADL